MKKVTIILVLLTAYSSHCQSWQWGKRGGATDALVLSGFDRKEETYSLATDHNKNIYGLSRVGYSSLDIDNVTKSNFDNGSSPSDYALFSYACDGSYRWSKIIGGVGDETIHPLQIDNQNNVYVAGRIGLCNYPDYPPRIDDDFVLSQTPTDCRTIFLAKYSDTGVLQWLKQPQEFGVDQMVSYSQTASRGIQTDASGTTYWLLLLPPGTYADGAFVNTMVGSNLFIIKYDSDGNYIGNIPLDIHTTGGFGFLNFYLNPYNGQFYFYATRFNSSDTATVGGNSVSHSTFLASFDAQGNFLWKREDTFADSGYLNIYNLAFDSDNNIYIGGKIAGFNFGSFLGFSVADPIIPGFVMKTNPDASQVLWSSNSNGPSEIYGSIVLNGNELGYTSYCGGSNFSWGTQTLNVNVLGQGQEVLLARFNKNTGACIGLTHIPGNPGFNDVGTSITADASGDYILGGSIGGTLTFNNGPITNSGSQSDFFVAKYATQACSPLAVNENSSLAPSLYPNPTKGIVQFDNSKSLFTTVSVYTYLGQEVIKALDCSQDATPILDLSKLSHGVYLVKLSGEHGTFSSKIVKH